MFHRLQRFCILLLLVMAASGTHMYAQQDSTDAYSEDVEVAPEPPAAEASDYDEAEEGTVQYQHDIAPVATAPVQQSRHIDERGWHRMTDDPDFQYDEPQAPKPRKGSLAWAKLLAAVARFFTSGVGYIIIIALVALLVVFIIVRIFQLNGNIFFSRKDKKLPAGDIDENSDLFIPDNWEKAIQDAAATGNYRLAVRHAYRYLLHLLQEKEVIRFQAAKTNYQYAYDLSETKLYQPFLQLTRQYEYAWYGGFAVGKEGFDSYTSLIDHVKKDLH